MSAYAVWGGSLPADVAEQRLQQALVLSKLPPDKFARTLLPAMFSSATPREDVEDFAESMLEFHPAGFRAMARASAEDLRHTLPDIKVPTLLVCGDQDARAPLSVADDLRAVIPGSTLQLGGPELSLHKRPAGDRTLIQGRSDRRYLLRPSTPSLSSGTVAARALLGGYCQPVVCVALLISLTFHVETGGFRPQLHRRL